MLFDLVSYSGWLIVALGIGLVVGWRTYLKTPRRNWGDEWIVLGAVAFVVGIIVAALKLLPGRYGLWLEIALLMMAVYIVGCFLGGGLKRLLGAHESGAKAAADRLAVEVAARAEAERERAEIERRAAAAAKAEAERLAAATLAKAEAERLTAAAVAKALADRRVLAVNGDADRLAPAAAAIGETESARAEPAPSARKLTRRHTPSERRAPPATCRRIVLWRKPPQRPRLNEKQIRPPKPRRVVWLQRVSQRSRRGEAPPLRPMRRRTLWLRRLPRPRPIGTPNLHYLRRRSEQT